MVTNDKLILIGGLEHVLDIFPYIYIYIYIYWKCHHPN